MQEQINQLKAQIESLKSELEQIKSSPQQISYPIDTTSKDIIFDAIEDKLDTAEFGTFTAGLPTAGGTVELTVNDVTYTLLTT